MKLYPETKALIVTLFLFFTSISLLKYTKANFSDTEKLLGNSIEVGVWNSTPSPSEPINTPTLTPTPIEVPPGEPTIIPSPTATNIPIPTNTPTPTPTPSTLPWINEIHYDNTGTDTNEGIEIAGPANTNLSGWSIVLYNGNGGASYNIKSLTGIISDQQSGYGTIWFDYPVDGIQNGDPDGISLISPSNSVVQFLSYEGTFTAVNGPALGIPSVDIGRSETGSEPIGQSLQLQGSGNKYNDFTWIGPILSTYGAINIGQSFN